MIGNFVGQLVGHVHGKFFEVVADVELIIVIGGGGGVVVDVVVGVVVVPGVAEPPVL